MNFTYLKLKALTLILAIEPYLYYCRIILTIFLGLITTIKSSSLSPLFSLKGELSIGICYFASVFSSAILPFPFSNASSSFGNLSSLVGGFSVSE